ncbi:hypothetical protein ACJX0J_000413, partial [Zea mays]
SNNNNNNNNTSNNNNDDDDDDEEVLIKESMSLNFLLSPLSISFCDVLSSWVNHTLAGRVEYAAPHTTEILIYWAKSEALSGLKCLEVRNNMFTSIGFLGVI